MIPGIAQGLRTHTAGRADDLQQKLLLVTARCGGQLGDERLDRERMGNESVGLQLPTLNEVSDPLSTRPALRATAVP